ncbi:hypothetical protein AAL_08232 [Moelleriella libera RCEF 2490]|uniref:Uncharacterized protein n=1 Tax=Moelleriella libera RCEF 2490 TaxID=1081109 RepID=A0A167VVS8_9HYPO|nr:hypothetical protein AAL_08232 [Moelleriella libera RCEF 2490]
MRFSTSAILLVVGTAMAAPSFKPVEQSSELQKRSDSAEGPALSLLERSAGDLVARSTLTDALSAIADLKEAADIDKVDQALDKAFGGAITRFNDYYGFSFAGRILKISGGGASPGKAQAIIGALWKLLSAGGTLAAADDYLFYASKGQLFSLERALGVEDLEIALGIKK